MRQSLATAVAEAPYASLSEEEARALAGRLVVDATGVARTLEREADVHYMCDNMIKGDVLLDLASRVIGIAIGVPWARREVKGRKEYAVCPKCDARIELKTAKDSESNASNEYAAHYIAEHA